MTARYQAALATLRRRGILPEDLPPALRDRMQTTSRRLARDDPVIVEKELLDLEGRLQRVKLDRALVEAKLRRVDRRLKRTRPLPAGLKDRADQALQAFMDERFQEANRHLNGILRALRRR